MSELLDCDCVRITVPAIDRSSLRVGLVFVVSHRGCARPAGIGDADSRRSTRQRNVLPLFVLLVPFVVLGSNLRRQAAVVQLNTIFDPAKFL